MTETATQSDLFLQFNRRKLALLLVIVLVVGAIGLALMLTPVGPVWRSVARASIVPVVVAIAVLVQLAIRSRRWAPSSPEVEVAMQDEWQKTNMARASRTAFVVLLVAQWPLAIIIGFLGFPAPRGAMAMGMATVTLGLATQLGTFLFLDRE